VAGGKFDFICIMFRIPFYILSITLLLLSFNSSIKTNIDNWDTAVLEKANSAQSENYLTDDEKKLIFLTNLVRVDPQLFLKTYVQRFVDSTQYPSNKWIASLKKDLQKAKPLEILQPDKELFEVARKHAKDMGLTGKIGHSTSKGGSYEKRIPDLKKKYSFIGENCNYGSTEPLKILMDLLIDENTADLGHRKNILCKDFRFLNVNTQPHKNYKINTVMEFGG
jgi:hypothetical protein